MLNLLLQYLKKTQKVWGPAFLITLLIFVMISLFLLIPGMLYLMTIYLVVNISIVVLQRLGFEEIPKPFITVLFAVSFIFMPWLALTATNVLAVAAICSIPFFFEVFDVFAQSAVGLGFSLKKLLLNPIGRLETLRPILEGQTLDYARYLNLLNDITSPDAEGYCESIEFSPDQKAELIARQTQAMTHLPEDFKALRAEIEAREWDSSNLGATIAGKKAAYQAYRSDLSDAQQTCLDTILDSTLDLTHAICCVSHEPLSPDNQDQFIMLEKRYKEGENWHAVPHETKFFYFEPDERDMFLNLAQYNKDLKRWTITNPLNRDPLFKPSLYGASLLITQYRLYHYQNLASYPLSLEVCEAMEAFNHSMQIRQETRPTDVQQSDLELMPPFNRHVTSVSSSLSGHNIFAARQSKEIHVKAIAVPPAAVVDNNSHSPF